MIHYKKYVFHIITTIVLAVAILLMAGCKQSNDSTVTTTQYESHMIDEDTYEEDWDYDAWEDEDTTTTTKTTVKKTVSAKKNWKQAYIDFIYELEDKYDNVSYYPCGDFTGDEIGDFICAVGNENDYSEKEIAVAYYNGGVGTISSEVGFLGFDGHNYYLLASADDDGVWSIDDDRMKYYKFENGKFVLEKIDEASYYWADHQSTGGCLKYEMINKINNGDF